MLLWIWNWKSSQGGRRHEGRRICEDLERKPQTNETHLVAVLALSSNATATQTKCCSWWRTYSARPTWTLLIGWRPRSVLIDKNQRRICRILRDLLKRNGLTLLRRHMWQLVKTIIFGQKVNRVVLIFTLIRFFYPLRCRRVVKHKHATRLKEFEFFDLTSHLTWEAGIK